MWADINFTGSSIGHSPWQKPSKFRQFLEYLPRAVGSQAIDRLERWSRRRALFAELSRMSDRDLADLGIGRGDFPAILDGTYQREETAFIPAKQEARPLTFVRDEEDVAGPSGRGEGFPLSGFFFPFGPRPDWYSRHWLGEPKGDDRLR